MIVGIRSGSINRSHRRLSEHVSKQVHDLAAFERLAQIRPKVDTHERIDERI